MGQGKWGWFSVAPTPLTTYLTPLPSPGFCGQFPRFPNLPSQGFPGGRNDDYEGYGEKFKEGEILVLKAG